jgi:Flp pilus assembly pilin Flp
MRRFIEKLRSLRDNKRGSVPVQYALVAGLTALVATTVAQTVTSKVADKINAVTSALNKIPF